MRCRSGRVVQLVYSGPASYISASGLPPSSVIGNTITWNVADFGTVNLSDLTSRFKQILRSARLAGVLHGVRNANCGDNNPANNVLTLCFTVVGSYDPNDKQVYPSAEIDTTQEWLTYTIRFQTPEQQKQYTSILMIPLMQILMSRAFNCSLTATSRLCR